MAGNIHVSEYPKSYQFGLLGKRGGIFCLVLYLSAFCYQFIQMFLWLTVWKENRYYCPHQKSKIETESPIPNREVCGTSLGLLIAELVLEAVVIFALLVKTQINHYPIRMDGLRQTFAVDDTTYHMMTSSSRLNIIKYNNFTIRSLLAAFLTRSLSEVLVFTNDSFVDTDKNVFWVSRSFRPTSG